MDTSEVKVNTRQLLVLVNPASGQGKSVELFQTQVQPMFDMAELKYTVVVTGVFIMTSHVVSAVILLYRACQPQPRAGEGV